MENQIIKENKLDNKIGPEERPILLMIGPPPSSRDHALIVAALSKLSIPILIVDDLDLKPKPRDLASINMGGLAKEIAVILCSRPETGPLLLPEKKNKKPCFDRKGAWEKGHGQKWTSIPNRKPRS